MTTAQMAVVVVAGLLSAWFCTGLLLFVQVAIIEHRHRRWERHVASALDLRGPDHAGDPAPAEEEAVRRAREWSP